jgi:hypothetical protein
MSMDQKVRSGLYVCESAAVLSYKEFLYRLTL